MAKKTAMHKMPGGMMMSDTEMKKNMGKKKMPMAAKGIVLEKLPPIWGSPERQGGGRKLPKVPAPKPPRGRSAAHRQDTGRRGGSYGTLKSGR